VHGSGWQHVERAQEQVPQAGAHAEREHVPGSENCG
jgi:hypothetical protein